MPASISLEEGNGYVNRMRQHHQAAIPKCETVVSQHGRPDDGTDATGFFNAEFFVPLKPFDTWPAGMDKDKLIADHDRRAAGANFPASISISRRYIEDNVEEAASGVKGENSVKLYGNDLETLEKTADKIKDVMATVPGITDLAVFNSLGQPTVQDRRRPRARGALRPGARRRQCDGPGGDRRPGGGQSLRRRQRPQLSRSSCGWRPNIAQSLDAIRRITIGAPNPNGNGVVQIPLTDVADVQPGLRRRRSSIARARSATSRSSSACAAAISAARCWRRSSKVDAAGPIARRLPPGMGRRIRQSAGGDRAPGGRRAAQPCC